MIQIISAIITGLFTILFTLLAGRHIPAKLIATGLLCSIAFIYVGFSLQNPGAAGIITEGIAAFLFYLIAVIGYAKNSYLIAIGIVAHGMWDIIHENGFLIKTSIPAFWPMYCLVTDIITGIYFYFLFKMQRVETVIVKCL